MATKLRIVILISMVLCVSVTRAQLETRTLAQVLAETEEFSLFYAALEAGGLVGMLSNPDALYTMFAVENEHINDPILTPSYYILPGEFTYYELSTHLEAARYVTLYQDDWGRHAVSIQSDGTQFSVEGIQVTATDTMAANGVIHTLAAPLSLDPIVIADPPTPSPTPPDFQAPTPAPLYDLVQTLIDAAQFTYFVALLETTGWTERLQDRDHEWTVFAPTDAVWQTPDSRARPDDALMYYLIPARFDTLEVRTTMLPSLDGARLGTLAPGAAHILEHGTIQNVPTHLPPIRAANGVIYIIDTMLTPPENSR